MKRKLSVNEDKFVRSVGRNVADARKTRGLTQEDVAEKADLDRVTIAYIETGKRTPKLTTLYQISKVLKVDVQSFFDGV